MAVRAKRINIIEEKNRQYLDRVHRAKLAEIKPRINNASPPRCVCAWARVECALTWLVTGTRT